VLLLAERECRAQPISEEEAFGALTRDIERNALQRENVEACRGEKHGKGLTCSAGFGIFRPPLHRGGKNPDL
jgi:hypothetical protein